MHITKRIFIAAIALMVTAAVASAGFLATDTNALGAWQGAVTFDTTNQSLPSLFEADLDFAVYAPGNFDPSPGFSLPPECTDDYVYAYQITEVRDGSFNGGFAGLVSQLSVGVTGGGDNVGLIGYCPLTGDVVPTTATAPIGGSSAVWTFSPENVDTGEDSAILYFTSPYAPQWKLATASGSGALDTQTVPSPIPEPATVLVLVGGTAAMIARRAARKAN